MKRLNKLKLLLVALVSVFSISMANAQCSASFTTTDLGGGNFSFNNTSTGNSLFSSWDFGDGNYASTVNAQNTYLYNGAYSVCLTIYDSITQCSSTFCDSILVSGTANPCTTFASFSFVDNGNGNFSFTNTSAGNNAYQWSFGDGNNSSTASPNHTYSANGTYTVNLMAYDLLDSNCSDSYVATITVNGIGGSGCNYTVTAVDSLGTDIYFFVSPWSGTSSYFWDFGDGTTSTNSGPIHTYAAPGTYYYCVTIDSCPPICDSVIVTYGNPPCNLVASFISTDNGNGNYSFTSSVTGGTAPYLYSWNFGGGNTNTTANPNYTFPSNGVYSPTLLVTDANGCTSVVYDSIVVATNSPCNINASFTFTDNGNGNYSFTNTSTSNVNSHIWNFGDGTSSPFWSPNHTFTANGTFVVGLHVLDSSGQCADYYLATITVTGVTNPVPCQAGFIIYADSTGNGVTVINSSTGNNLTYFWDFGDGNTSTLQFPNYTYTANGPFSLCLTVDNGAGCTSTYCDSIGSNGVVMKQTGFNINVISPTTTTAINEGIDLVSELNTYPNPATDKVTIEINLNDQTQVEVLVIDLVGNIVANITNQEMNSGLNKIQWNTSDIANGVYLLNVKTNNNTKINKLVINK